MARGRGATILRDYITNLQVPLPWYTKIRLVARNMARRVLLRQTCCGHPGEPGC